MAVPTLAKLLLVLVTIQYVAATYNIINIKHKMAFRPAVLRNRKPVVVVYYSKKCTSCQWVVPELERVAKNKSEDFYLAKVDTDKVPDLIKEHHIRKEPSIYAYMRGKRVGAIEGAQWGKMVRLINKTARLK